jgi:hypothetical protein
MNCITKKKIRGALPGGRGIPTQIKPWIKSLAGWVASSTLFFGFCAPAHGGLLKPDVDYSSYDMPLFLQVVNRIKTKIAARLGEGENKQDRYFVVPFAFQDRGNNPEFSHSFISVIRVLADGKQPSLNPGFRRGQFKNRNFEAFTIKLAASRFRYESASVRFRWPR